MELRMSDREILEVRMQAIAGMLVERARLKIERIESRTGAAPFPGVSFGLAYHVAAEADPPERAFDSEHVDRQPAPDGRGEAARSGPPSDASREKATAPAGSSTRTRV
jgi:hypothetical protein